jgi:hypothetical protein
MAYRSKVAQVLSLVCVMAFETSCASAETAKGPVSIADAKNLVFEAVKPDNPGASVDYHENKYDPDFYSFEVSWDNPKGSMIAGHFAVNSFTGEVWSIEGSVCSQADNPTIKKLQNDIRDRLHVSKQEIDAGNSKMPSVCQS